MPKGKHCTIIVILLLLGFFLLYVCEKDRCKGHKQLPPSKYYYKIWWLLAPLNTIVAQHAPPDHQEAFVPLHAFPGHKVLERHWKTIREEAINSQSHTTPMSNLVRFTERIGDKRWTVLLLFWYGEQYPENQALCPETTRLLRSLPQVHAAMFSVLPPGKEIPPHRGPFRGCLRYHLGLKVPKQRENCFINVDGANYHWKEGESALFDDTYVHTLFETTQMKRELSCF